MKIQRKYILWGVPEMLTGAKRREFSGMIPVITSNGNNNLYNWII
jgi:hypothetical protein